jgi:hypothetical protein
VQFALGIGAARSRRMVRRLPRPDDSRRADFLLPRPRTVRERVRITRGKRTLAFVDRRRSMVRKRRSTPSGCLALEASCQVAPLQRDPGIRRANGLWPVRAMILRTNSGARVHRRDQDEIHREGRAVHRLAQRDLPLLTQFLPDVWKTDAMNEPERELKPSVRAGSMRIREDLTT